MSDGTPSSPILLECTIFSREMQELSTNTCTFLEPPTDKGNRHLPAGYFSGWELKFWDS
jgi:hypothetical protein